jgi:hypothetical protein
MDGKMGVPSKAVGWALVVCFVWLLYLVLTTGLRPV